jgi:hypothetical protein
VVGGGKAEYSFSDLKKHFQADTRQGVPDAELLGHLRSLTTDGVVRVDPWFGTPSKERTSHTGDQVTAGDTYVLRSEWVPRDKARFTRLADSLWQGVNEDEFGKLAHRDVAKEYQGMASEVVYAKFFTFMKDAMVQKATNALHDVFCKSGLFVSSAVGQSTVQDLR